jgi:hypothetical protein
MYTTQQEFSFIVLRGFTSSGHVDPNLILNLKNAQESHLGTPDIYFFPCVTCVASPADQVCVCVLCVVCHVLILLVTRFVCVSCADSPSA